MNYRFTGGSQQSQIDQALSEYHLCDKHRLWAKAWLVKRLNPFITYRQVGEQLDISTSKAYHCEAKAEEERNDNPYFLELTGTIRDRFLPKTIERLIA